MLVSPPLPSHSSSPSPFPHAAGFVSPTGYTPKVSFDTFENPVASMFSFTLQVKSAGYARTRSTRVFLCAAGPDESGREALDWSLESLVQDGDELVVCRGIDEDVFGAFAFSFPFLTPFTEMYARQRKTTTAYGRRRGS
jgi:hypothetical protein